MANNDIAGGPPPYFDNHWQEGIPTLTEQREELPPLYQAIFADPHERFLSDVSPTVHYYSPFKPGGSMLGRAQRPPWLELELVTRPTRDQRWMAKPRYFGGDDISGRVKLTLDGSQSVNSINIELRGRIVTYSLAEGTWVFLEHIVPIQWPQPSNGPTGTNKSTGRKSSGTFDIPFNFPFPTEVDLANTAKGKRDAQAQTVYLIPQSFLERNVPINIEYELCLRIGHGIFRSDTKIKVPLVFIPEITPEPPSGRRQVAYAEEALQLPCPVVDPEGWFASSPCVISGTLGEDLSVEVGCLLHLTRPLCYTRGRFISCYMTLSCSNADALLQLSKPDVQNIRLTRSVSYFDDVSQGIEKHIRNRVAPISHRVEVIEAAVWWERMKEDFPDANHRILEGEIHLPKELVPTSMFPPFRVEYVVEVLPFKSRSFRPLKAPTTCSNESNTSSQVILSQTVTIATFDAMDGPRPTPYSQRPRRPSVTVAATQITTPQYGISAIPGL